jgi:hypothetical protein
VKSFWNSIMTTAVFFGSSFICSSFQEVSQNADNHVHYTKFLIVTATGS